MKFKKIVAVAVFSMCTALLTPSFAANESPATRKENTTNVTSEQLTNRLLEIRNMDKSQLTRSEKRELRKEVKEIRRERKSNGVYLSVGAIIIIALLLIILL